MRTPLLPYKNADGKRFQLHFRIIRKEKDKRKNMMYLIRVYEYDTPIAPGEASPIQEYRAWYVHGRDVFRCYPKRQITWGCSNYPLLMFEISPTWVYDATYDAEPERFELIGELREIENNDLEKIFC